MEILCVCVLLCIHRGGIIITDIFYSDVANGSHYSLGNQSQYRVGWCKSDQIRATSAEDSVLGV